MAYNFSVALCYLTLHQIIQKLEKPIFLLKCVARWVLNLDTRFNWAPPSFLYYFVGSLHSPEPRWILCKHCLTRTWRREGESLVSSLPTAALNMAHRGGKEMNKDELSALKISREQKQLTLPNPSVNLARKGKHIATVDLCVYWYWQGYLFNRVPLNIRGVCEKPHGFLGGSHHILCIGRRSHCTFCHNPHWTEPWKRHRHNW